MLKLFVVLACFSVGLIAPSDVNNIKFSVEALNAHNQYRFLHGAAPLQLNPELNQIAQQRAEEMAQLGKLNAKRVLWNNETLGELVGAIKGADSFNGISATEQWYSTINKFDTNGILTKTSSSFSQMVWRTTTLCGFGIARDQRGRFYYVAEYWTKGNIAGHYDENVLQISKRDFSECDNEAIEIKAGARSLIPTVDDVQTLSRILATDEVKTNLNNIINSFGRNLLNTLQTTINIIKSNMGKSDASLIKTDGSDFSMGSLDSGLKLDQLLKNIPQSLLDKIKLRNAAVERLSTETKDSKSATPAQIQKNEA